MKISSHVRRGSAGTQGGGSVRTDSCGVDVIHLDAVRAALASLPPDAGIQRVGELLALLSNPTRLKLLLALQPVAPAPRRELCVCDLAAVSGASKSMTSHQLRLLRTAGIVRQRRAGKLAFYRLAEGPLFALLADVARVASEARIEDYPQHAPPTEVAGVLQDGPPLRSGRAS